MQISRLLLSTIILAANVAYAGPVAYGACQAGCAGIVMACYAAAGATWGATAGVTAPATVVACNLAFGKCSATCTSLLLIPFL